MENRIKIHFICVGFQKCGTTLLQEMLMQNPEVFLSKRKENWFFQWKDSCKDPLKKLKEDFFEDAPKGKKLGVIDPTYVEHAHQISRYFGKNCKIIIMVRNPADVIWSDFKMRARTCQDEAVLTLYRKYGFQRFRQMFDEYVTQGIKEKKINKYYFSKLIKKYYTYFPHENIRIVFFEELISNPAAEMRAIEEFLGTGNYSYQVKKVNEGDTVSRNYLCAWMNKWVFRLHMKLYAISMSWEKRLVLYEIRGKIFERTHREYRQNMKQSTRKRLEEYFADEKKALKELAGREHDT